MKNNSGNWLLMVYFVIAFAVAAMFTSCSATNNIDASYRHHLRTTYRDNFMNQDNGGCGWYR
jgi:hypothetical protein